MTNRENRKRLMGTLLDITAQKQDKDIQRKLKTLADHSADLMSLLEQDGVNSYVNAAGKYLLGFADDEEVRRTPIASLHEPEDLEQVKREVLPAVMNKGRWTGTMRVRHLKTGEVFPVLNHTIRIDDPESGKPIGIGAIMRDLRPELAAKKALAESEQLLRELTSAAPTALWMANADGEVSYVNQTWVEWTGRPAASHLGQGWLASVLEEDRAGAAASYQTAVSTRRPFEMEFRIRDSKGQIRWCQAGGRPRFDTQGELKGYAGACVDLTAQKELQRHKDDFISIASHELKTPVTSLNGALQIIDRLKDKPGDPMLARFIMQARKSADRVGSLITDLLHVGRLQQKEIPISPSLFVLSQLMNGCANPVAISSRKKIRISGEMELEVFADESRIDQVITNFLTNAVKYAPDADTIDVRLSLPDIRTVRVAVTDHGPGIAPEKTGQLFDRYYRVDDSAPHVSGMGLGLYICKEIIARHGGAIGVESVLGQGSTFWFTLPIKTIPVQ